MPTPSAPPAEAVGRFQRDLERLTGSGTAFRLGIAVSGGPDSLALLRLAHAAMPGHIRAATVDHGLRPEAAREAAANRAKHGRTKAERQNDRRAEERRQALLDGAKREE